MSDERHEVNDASAPAPADANASADADAAKTPAPPAEPAPEPAADASSEADASPKADASEASADGKPETVEAAEGDAPKKKKRKRKRRRKKKNAEGETPSEGAEAAADAKGSEQAKGPAKGKANAGDDEAPPLQRFFEGAEAATRQASGFKAGSIVAGHVVFAGEGVAVINLYGKGTAFVLEDEPREVPKPVVVVDEEPDQEPGPEPEPEPGPEPDQDQGQDQEPEPEPEPEPDQEPAASKAHFALGNLSGADEAAPDPDPAPETGSGSPDPEPGPGSPDPDPGPGSPDPETGSGSPDPDPGPGSPDPGPDAPDAPSLPALQPGDLFRGRLGAVASSGHAVIVNRIVDRPAAREKLKEAKKNRARVEGLVFGFNRGGFDVLVEGLRAFCPVRGLTLDPIDDPSKLLGRKLEFFVQSAKSGKQGIVVSRRSLLEREARKRARKRLASLEVGSKVAAKVTEIRDYGLLVDLDGVLGLVHQTELSWDRSVRPRKAAKVGQELELVVLRLPDKKDKSSRYVSLSLKATQQDPWEAAAEELKPGRPLKGRVVSVTEFGAFVHVADKIEGLLHISEIGEDPATALKKGDHVHVIIEHVDQERRRVSLSRMSEEEAKAFDEGTLEIPEQFAKPPRRGSTTKVVVESASKTGIVVKAPGVLGKRGRGFIRPGDTGTPRGTDLRRKYKQGQELEVKVVATERDGSFKASIKALAHDEERQAIRAYKKKAQQQKLGTLGDLFAGKFGQK